MDSGGMQENMWLFQKGHLLLNFQLDFTDANSFKGSDLVTRFRDPLVLASTDYRLDDRTSFDYELDVEKQKLTGMLKTNNVAKVAFT